jgi:uncharacterized MAPEG superfamily protein
MDVLELPIKTVLLLGIAGAAVCVYFPFFAVGAARVQAGYDPAAPRSMFDKLPDWGQRATWAHQNGWESFMLFTAAALMAYVSGTEDGNIRIAVIAYLGARVLFSVFYIVNQPILRSMMFAIGTTAIFTLMSGAIRASLG